MMGNQVDLLRLLEPAARPAGLPAPSAPGPRNLPIESRSFDSLLTEAQKLPDESATPAAETTKIAKPTGGLLQGLSRVDRIENGSLLGLIGRVER